MTRVYSVSDVMKMNLKVRDIILGPLENKNMLKSKYHIISVVKHVIYRVNNRCKRSGLNYTTVNIAKSLIWNFKMLK